MYSVFTNVGRVKPHLPTKRTAQSDHERAAKSGIYEKTTRSRSFVEALGKEFPWVVDGYDYPNKYFLISMNGCCCFVTSSSTITN